MQQNDLSTILPIAIPLGIAVVLFLKPRRERPLHMGRLWIVPVLVTLLIGMGLAFTPHEPFGPLAYIGFVVAAGLGGLTGWWRAKTVAMRYDAAAGQVMARTSNFAVLVLVGLMALRSAVRLWLENADLGLNIGAVTDAFLIFAIGLVVGQRVEMWIRAQALKRNGTDSDTAGSRLSPG